MYDQLIKQVIKLVHLYCLLYDLLIKRVILRILDTFSKQVGFGSTHIIEYSWLDTTQHDMNPTREHKLPPLPLNLTLNKEKKLENNFDKNISSTSLKISTK